MSCISFHPTHADKMEVKHQNIQTKTVEIKDQQVQTEAITQEQGTLFNSNTGCFDMCNQERIRTAG